MSGSFFSRVLFCSSYNWRVGYYPALFGGETDSINSQSQLWNILSTDLFWVDFDIEFFIFVCERITVLMVTIDRIGKYENYVYELCWLRLESKLWVNWLSMQFLFFVFILYKTIRVRSIILQGSDCEILLFSTCDVILNGIFIKTKLLEI